MTIKLFNEESNIVIRSVPDSNVIDHVPPAVYRLRENPMSGEIILVKDRAKFDLPGKCYGKHNVYKQAILDAWLKNKEASTGVLLRGIKGAGKSLLAEDLSNQAIARDMPVIMVDKEVTRTALTVATKMAGPCVMYFDEFGKTFDSGPRRDLLTYFSDSSFKQVLFIVTSNSKKELDKYMLDRPGRFLFRIDYKKLDPIVISEMIDDHGLTPEMTTMLNAYVKQREVTFDMLRWLVPIAAETADPHLFNDRISIYNCPGPVYPHMRVQKILFQGEPFYGRAKIKVVSDGKYNIELSKEGVKDAVFTGTLDMETSHKVVRDDLFARDFEFFLDGDVVLMADQTWQGTAQTEWTDTFLDPAVVEKRKAEGTDPSELRRGMLLGGMSGMGMHELLHREMLTGSHRKAELSEEQKSLLALAQHIVDRDKADKPAEAEAEPAAPAQA